MATSKKKTKVIMSAETAETLEPKVSKKAKEAKKVIKKVKEELSPNVASGGWPKIQQGTHLTVKTFEDGKTELIWDDEALAREVREAIASVESKPKKVKKTKAS